MKRVLSVVFQFILYLVVFGIGSLLPGANVLPTWSISTGPGRVFVYDGLLLMLLVYVVILLIAAVRKRINITFPNSTMALVLALLIGLLWKFGFKSV
ncbi:MAG: hypothetical protein ABR971_09385 [Acidobacteriaceae bacterium]|jgi:hypothetical protein